MWPHGGGFSRKNCFSLCTAGGTVTGILIPVKMVLGLKITGPIFSKKWSSSENFGPTFHFCIMLSKFGALPLFVGNKQQDHQGTSSDFVPPGYRHAAEVKVCAPAHPHFIFLRSACATADVAPAFYTRTLSLLVFLRNVLRISTGFCN